MIDKKELAQKIQYTKVRADATSEMIRRHWQQAIDFGFNAVMLQPCWIRLALDILTGTDIRIAAAICYPRNKFDGYKIPIGVEPDIGIFGYIRKLVKPKNE